MSEDMQITIFGSEIPHEAVVQNAICTRDDNCTAQADEHAEDCPVEQRLREEFGGM